MLPRRRFYRRAFVLAGAYNIAWGTWSALDPQWFFRFTGPPALNHPAIFACLGMVVGVYGLLYFEVARAPERGWWAPFAMYLKDAWPAYRAELSRTAAEAEG